MIIPLVLTVTLGHGKDVVGTEVGRDPVFKAEGFKNYEKPVDFLAQWVLTPWVVPVFACFTLFQSSLFILLQFV